MIKKINNIVVFVISLIFLIFCTSILVLYLYNNLPLVLGKTVNIFNGSITLFFIAALIIAFALLLLIIKILKKYAILDNKSARIAIIILCVVIPRIVWINLLKITPKADFLLYYNLAGQYARGNYIGGGYVSLFPHTFGYPAFLSIFYRLTGPGIFVAQLLNILLCCILGLLLYKLGDMIDNWKAGFIAAVIWAFWPSQILYTLLVSTEALFSLLMLFCIILFFYILKHKEKYKEKRYVRLLLFLLLGLACSVTNAIRPFGLLLIMAFFVYYFLFYVFEEKLFKSFIFNMSLFILFIISYLVFFNIFSFGISHAIGRNVARSPIGFNLYVGSNIKYNGTWNIEDSNMLYEVFFKNSSDAQKTHNQLTEMAFNRFIDQKSGNLRLFLNKFKIMWLRDDDIIRYLEAGLVDTDPSSMYLSKYFNRLKIICNLFYIIMILFSTISSIWLIKGKANKEYLLPVLIILGIFAIHSLVEVHGRYHYPAISILALLSGCFIKKISSIRA